MQTIVKSAKLFVLPFTQVDMINFQLLINLLTDNGRYKWFYLPASIINEFTPEERAQWYEESMDSLPGYRIYYPRENFLIGLDKDGLRLQLMKAAERGD